MKISSIFSTVALRFLTWLICPEEWKGIEQSPLRRGSAISHMATTPEVVQSSLDRVNQHSLIKENDLDRIEEIATAGSNFKSHPSTNPSRKRRSLGRNSVGSMIPIHH